MAEALGLALFVLVVCMAAAVIGARAERCGWCGRPALMHDRLEDGRLMCSYPRRWR